MKITYSFDLVIDLDMVVVKGGDSYAKAVKESIDEFISELHGFIEQHPLIEGATMNAEIDAHNEQKMS